MRSLFLCMTGVSALRLTTKTEGTGNENIAKLLRALNKMKDTLESDLDKAEKANDKMVCFCKKIKDLQEEHKVSLQTFKQQTATAKQEGATAAKNKAEAAQAKKEMEKAQTDLNDQNTDRAADKAKFVKTRADLTETLTALNGAITVLSNPTKASMVQVQKMLSNVPKATALLQNMQQPEYKAQSGQITGVLTQLEEDFKKDLSEAEQKEADDVENHNDWVANQNDVIAAHKQTMQNKNQAAADASAARNKALAAAKRANELHNGLGETITQKSQMCANQAKIYKNNRDQQSSELNAINDVIKIATSDSMHTAKNAVFLQTSSVSDNRQKAIRALKSVGQTALAEFASQGRFDKVIKVIGNLVAELRSTMKSDQAQFDSCTADNNTLTQDVVGLTNDIDSNENFIQQKTSELQTLDEDKSNAEDDEKKKKQELNEQAQDRAKANQEYQREYTENVEYENLLNSMLSRMQAEYGSKGAKQNFIQAPKDSGSDLMNEMTADQPAQQQKAAKQDGGAVIQMIESLVAKSKKTNEEETIAENTSQTDFENFVKKQNRLIKDIQADITTLTSNIGQTTNDKISKESKNDVDTKEKEQTENAQDKHMENCKFIWDNLALRKQNFIKEIDGLEKAKAFLKGMSA